MKRGIILSAVFLALVLSLSLLLAQESQDSVEFTTGAMMCNATATTAYWVNSSSGQQTPVTNCKAYATTSLPSCCPTGFTCNSTTGSCVDGSRITDCTKYGSEADCIADDLRVGLVSVSNSSNCGLSSYFTGNFFVPLGETCVNMTKCGCFWESGRCSAKKKSTVECPGGSLAIGNCTWNTFNVDNEDCSNTNLPITITSTATWYPGPQANAQAQADCKNLTRTYPCVSTAALPFFTLPTLMVSLGIIVFVYFILYKKR
jgi:hypothetical protein